MVNFQHYRLKRTVADINNHDKNILSILQKDSKIEVWFIFRSEQAERIFLLIIAAVGISLTANVLRFNVSVFLNQPIFSAASLILVETAVYFYGSNQLSWTILLFIVTAGYSFKLIGGIVAALFSVLIVYLHTEGFPLAVLPIYLVIGASAGYISQYLLNKKSKHHGWMYMLMEQSKHLQVFREVSTTMQGTLQQDLLLKVISTSVTAGHGHPFLFHGFRFDKQALI